MPATVSHNLSATTPDDTNYEIQPKHWNSGHAISFSVSATEISGLFSNANGVSFGLSQSSITASHNALTTARASNDAIGLNTAKTNVTWTVNSSGVSFDAGGYAGTGFTTTTAAGDKIAGTHDTAGLKLGVPAYLTTAMLSNAATISNINVSAGTTSQNLSNVVFSNSNGVSFGLNGSTITAGMLTHSRFEPYMGMSLIGGDLNGLLVLNPVNFPNVQFDRLGALVRHTNATNSTGSITISYGVGIYTQNVSTLSLMHSSSTSFGYIFHGTVSSWSQFSVVRALTIPWTSTVTEGDYWIGCLMRSTSGGANASVSLIAVTQLGSAVLGIFGAATNASFQDVLGRGSYSAAAQTALLNSAAFSDIQGTNAANLAYPVIFFHSGTA